MATGVRGIAALALVAAGASQAWYGILMGGSSAWAFFQFGEALGLLLAAEGVRRGSRGSTWVMGGLTLSAVAAVPWFTRIASFSGIGPLASLANNSGSVLAASAAIAWGLGAMSTAGARGGVRLGLGLQAIGASVWAFMDAGASPWFPAYSLAVLGFASAAALFPAPVEKAPAGAPDVGPVA